MRTLHALGVSLFVILSATPAGATWTAVLGTRVASAPPTGRLTPVEDGSGGAFLLALTSTPVPGGVNEVRAYHVLASGDLAPGWPVDGAPVCSTSVIHWGCYESYLVELSACTDGSGGLYVGWGALPRLAGPIGFTARVVHLDASGARVAGWPAGGLAASDGAGQSALLVHPDGTGGVLVAWREERMVAASDLAPHLLLQHFLANGTRAPGVAARGKLMSSELVAYSYRLSPAFAPDPAGGAWALSASVSTDTAQAPSRFQVTRWNASGLETISNLDLPGVSADLAGPYPASATLWPDASGGTWVVVASNARGGCLAHHVLADGSLDPALPADGLALAAGAQDRPEPDGSGGFLVKDFSGFQTLALRHLLPSGQVDPAWASPVAIAGSNDVRLYPTPDGVLAAGWSLPVTYSCTPYEGIAVVGRVLANGTVPSTWPASGIEFPEIRAGVDASPLSYEFPMASCSDGQGGLIAFWTVAEEASDPLQIGDVRAMRFTAQGPVAGVAPASGSGALALERARFDRAGIHVTADGLAGDGATLGVHDLLGRRLAAVDLAAGSSARDVLVPGSAALRAGVYFLRLRSARGEARARVLVTR